MMMWNMAILVVQCERSVRDCQDGKIGSCSIQIWVMSWGGCSVLLYCLLTELFFWDLMSRAICTATLFTKSISLNGRGEEKKDNRGLRKGNRRESGQALSTSVLKSARR